MLKHYLDKANMTQAALSRDTDISAVTINSLCMGRSAPTIKTARRIIESLNAALHPDIVLTIDDVFPPMEAPIDGESHD